MSNKLIAVAYFVYLYLHCSSFSIDTEKVFSFSRKHKHTHTMGFKLHFNRAINPQILIVCYSQKSHANNLLNWHNLNSHRTRELCHWLAVYEYLLHFLFTLIGTFVNSAMHQNLFRLSARLGKAKEYWRSPSRVDAERKSDEKQLMITDDFTDSTEWWISVRPPVWFADHCKTEPKTHSIRDSVVESENVFFLYILV